MQNIRLEGPSETQHNPFISQMEEQTHVIRMRFFYICWRGKIKAKYLWSEISKLKDTKYCINPFFFFKRAQLQKYLRITHVSFEHLEGYAFQNWQRSALGKQDRDAESRMGAGWSTLKHFTLSFVYFVMFLLYEALYCFCNTYVHERV